MSGLQRNRAVVDAGLSTEEQKNVLGEMMQEGGQEAGDYMKQVIQLERVFGAAGGSACGMANKTIQTAGQYMTLGAALMNPVKTVTDVED